MKGNSKKDEGGRPHPCLPSLVLNEEEEHDPSNGSPEESPIDLPAINLHEEGTAIYLLHRSSASLAAYKCVLQRSIPIQTIL